METKRVFWIALAFVLVKVEFHSIRLKLHPEAAIAKGQMVWIQLPPHRCQAIEG